MINKDFLFAWILPFALSILFYIVWASKLFPTLSEMDGASLAVWNVILSYIILLIALLLHEHSGVKANNFHKSHPEHLKNQHSEHQQHSQSQVHHQQQMQQQHQQHASQLASYREHQLEEQLQQSAQWQNQAAQYMEQNHQYRAHIQKLERELSQTKQQINVTRQNVDVTLREIEAKAKGINFVVGRVYSEKHGGNKEIREMLHIDRDLYNSFSAITSDYSQSDKHELLKILKVIKNKLSLYELPERELFKIGESDLLRESDGSSSIIEVLSNNDKDPILDYYAGAKEVCDKVIAFLNQN
jgi:hypothetical protein